MVTQRQVAFWLAALVLAVAALYVLRGILLPFVAGLALAYLLDPLADRFERMGVGRLGATLLILVLFVLAFVLALVLLVPLLFHQVQSFVDRLPEYVDRLQALLVEQGQAVAGAARRPRGARRRPELRRRSREAGRSLAPRLPASACGPADRRSSACSRFSS